MKEITIPSHQALFDQTNSLVSDHGLILIGSSNQNRTLWASYEVMNVLWRKTPNPTRSQIAITVGELDQYTEHYRPASLEELESDMVVFGGNIRSLEKANLVLKAAKICPVVAISHSTSPISRLKDLGCDMNEVEDVVKAVYLFELD